MNPVPLAREATLEDLLDVDGRAELIDGEIVPVTPTGHRPNRSARRITVSLDAHEGLRGGGCAVGEGAGFVLRTPRTQVLSPDAAWWPGNVIAAGQIDGAPSFAAEVRSESDYGPAAERAMAIKRNLYFAAGTQVVWDVDVLREGWIRAYRADRPDYQIVYRRGEVADAEPAVPGWRFPVDALFS